MAFIRREVEPLCKSLLVHPQILVRKISSPTADGEIRTHDLPQGNKVKCHLSNAELANTFIFLDAPVGRVPIYGLKPELSQAVFFFNSLFESAW